MLSPHLSPAAAGSGRWRFALGLSTHVNNFLNKMKPNLLAALATATFLASTTMPLRAAPPAEQEAAATLRQIGLEIYYGRDRSLMQIGSYGRNADGSMTTPDPQTTELLADRVIWCSMPLTSLTLRPEPTVTDATLVLLQPLTELRVLRLRNSSITDAGLKLLASLAELREIRLQDTHLTDAGLNQLSGLSRLQVLSLSGIPGLTDSGLIHLAGLTNLQQLEFYSDNLTGAGLVHLKKMSNLQDLGLGGTHVTDASLEYLSHLTSLKKIDVNNSRVTGAGLVHLKTLKRLEWLALTQDISDDGLEQIADLTHVKMLHVGGPSITDAGLRSIGRMTSLENLSLNNTKITDAGLNYLVGLTNLTSLYLSRNAVSPERVAALRSALPKLTKSP